MKKLPHERLELDEIGELKKVNMNFVQLYDDHLELLMGMASENPTALTVFVWIIRFMDNRNALVASQQAIADSLGIHKNTVYLAVKYLKAKKAIDVFKSGSTNVFAVNAQIAWRDTADAKKYAHFDAKVYISELEQQASTQLIGHVKPIRKKPNGSKKMEAFENEGINRQDSKKILTEA